MTLVISVFTKQAISRYFKLADSQNKQTVNNKQTRSVVFSVLPARRLQHYHSRLLDAGQDTVSKPDRMVAAVPRPVHRADDHLPGVPSERRTAGSLAPDGLQYRRPYSGPNRKLPGGRKNWAHHR